MSRFLQVHTLTPYSAVLLNRNDSGFAKSLPFGNAVRMRVSSQCLKYHWRDYDGEHAIRKAGEMSIRSRHTFRVKVAKPLAEDEDLPTPLAAAAAEFFSEYISSGDRLSSSALEKIITADDPLDEIHSDDNGQPKQLLVLGRPEIRALQKFSREAVEEAQSAYPEDPAAAASLITDALAGRSNDLRDNLNGMRNAMGIDAAMHGRMVTSDALAQGDGAVHVAHAITTHAKQQRDDYFTAADDLQSSNGASSNGASAHLNTKELTSGLLYSYVVVDVPLLVSNLEGVPRQDWEDADVSLTQEIIRRFIHTIAKVSPAAKQSSTAPYSRAEFLMVESGREQPRQLSNAFKEAVPLDGNITRKSINRLSGYLDRVDGMYEPHEDRLCGSVVDADLPAPEQSIADIADWASQCIEPTKKVPA